MVISQDESIKLITNIFSAFQADVEEEKNYWQEKWDGFDPLGFENPRLMKLSARLAKLIINEAKLDHWDKISEFCDLLENLIDNGDETTRNALTIGFLQDIQNPNLIKDEKDIDKLKSLFGVNTIKELYKVSNFWDDVIEIIRGQNKH
jgi:hypothetical protein